MDCPIKQTVQHKFNITIQSFITESECYEQFIDKSLEYNEKFPIYIETHLLDLCNEWWNEYQSKYWEMNYEID